MDDSKFYRSNLLSVAMPSYDIAIVGSGIACSMTLCQLAERLKSAPTGNKAVRIAVIEKDGEMWNGIPYGRRSTIGALTFQRLQEFLEEPERTRYIEWLAANANTWLETLTECGGPGAAKWISDNQLAMEQGKWGELYLPRFLFGLYVSSLTTRAVKELSQAGLASVIVIHGEATAMARTPGALCNITISTHTGARTSLHATRVVLAIGSPPQKAIHDVADYANQHVHIENIYSPSENLSFKKIEQALSSAPGKKSANILIVGSNASALEVLYLINHRQEIRDRVASIVVLSRSGVLPYKVCEEAIQFELAALQSLGESDFFSAAELMAAISADLQRAQRLNLNIADLRDQVGAAVSRLIALMHVSEQERFVCLHGVHFSRMMRRAGRDTRNAADELTRLGILTTLKGQLCRLIPASSDSDLTLAAYSRADCNFEVVFPMPFKITINCGGFEELDCCSSPLINSLIENRLCTANSTNRGFLVNERLEASKNIYVIGPLVAGNFNDKVRFWHVESASRISGLAKALAESLYNSLYPTEQASTPDTATPRESIIAGLYPPCL